MSVKTLSAPAMKVISDYLQLPFEGHAVACPYINNNRKKVRGGLRVLLGKGSPAEIVEEANLIARRKKIDLATISDEQLQKFLVDHNLGIDCSGIVYHVMDAETLETKGVPLKRRLSFPYARNPIRTGLSLLRPIENANVKTIAHHRNSEEITIKDLRPGDLITIEERTGNSKGDHILLIHQVEYTDAKQPTVIGYTQASHWDTDGKYDHGARQGTIIIKDVNKGILEQEWHEKDKTGKDHENLQDALTAKKVELRRLH